MAIMILTLRVLGSQSLDRLTATPGRSSELSEVLLLSGAGWAKWEPGQARTPYLQNTDGPNFSATRRRVAEGEDTHVSTTRSALSLPFHFLFVQKW